MKKILVLLILNSALLGYSQPGKVNYGGEKYPTNIDSIVYYNYNISENTFSYGYTNSYFYDEDRIVEVSSKSSITGIPISRANYEFNSDGYKVEYINLLWQNGAFNNSFKQTYSYSSSGLLEEFISYTWTIGEWKFNNRYVHFYTNDLLTSIDIYSLDGNNQIVLKNKRTYEYEGDLLKRFYTVRVSDGVTMNTATYTHNSKGRVLSRFDEALTYDKILKKYFLLPSSRNSYTYDSYSLLREILTENWISGNWQNKQKMVYHYRIDFAKKVAICHNNHTIFVSKNSLPAHLNHGDILGKCVNSIINEKSKNQPATQLKEKDFVQPILLFPNPASEYSNISGIHKDFSRIELITISGNIVSTINNTGEEINTINRAGLPKGLYLVKIINSDGSIQTVKLLFR